MVSAIFTNFFLAFFTAVCFIGWSAGQTETRKLLNPLIITFAVSVVLYNGYLAWLAQ